MVGPVDSCLVLAVEADGAKLETIEGIAPAEGLDEIQTAFLTEAALQCGICTPGFIVSAKALLAEKPESYGRRDSLLPGRQPLPLHRLRQNCPRRSGRCRVPTDGRSSDIVSFKKY